MKGEQMMMTNEKMKINGCTPIEDLITEDFGAIGPPERDEPKIRNYHSIHD